MQGFSDNELEQMLRHVPLHRPSAALDRRVMETIRGDDRERSERSDDLAIDTAAPMSPAPSMGDEPPPRTYRLWWRLGSAMAACLAFAALVIIAVNSDQHGTNPIGPIAEGPVNASDDEFNPIRIEEVWSAVQPQGVVHVDDTPLRQYVQQTYERVQLIDEERNIHIEYTVPRQDLIVTPARFD